ncbi:hypothetical protein AMTRI_Chr10g227020 [Amborella trichopoda]
MLRAFVPCFFYAKSCLLGGISGVPFTCLKSSHIPKVTERSNSHNPLKKRFKREDLERVNGFFLLWILRPFYFLLKIITKIMRPRVLPFRLSAKNNNVRRQPAAMDLQALVVLDSD